MCGRTARTVREGGTGEDEAQARWTTCTRRETAGIEPNRRTGHTEPVPYFTTALGIDQGDRGEARIRAGNWGNPADVERPPD